MSIGEPELSQRLRVSLEEFATAEEVYGVEQALSDMGLTQTEVTANFVRRSAGPLPWQMIIEGSLSGVAAAVAQTGMSAAGHGLKRLFQHLYRAREGSSAPEGRITFVDARTQVWVNIRKADLDAPDAAWEKLASGESIAETTDDGVLNFHPHTQKWAPPS